MDDGYGPSSLISWMHKEIQRSKLCNFLNVNISITMSMMMILCLLIQAIKNRASLRVWILFTLIVLSFAILFLDWYS